MTEENNGVEPDPDSISIMSMGEEADAIEVMGFFDQVPFAEYLPAITAEQIDDAINAMSAVQVNCVLTAHDIYTKGVTLEAVLDVVSMARILYEQAIVLATSLEELRQIVAQESPG